MSRGKFTTLIYPWKKDSDKTAALYCCISVFRPSGHIFPQVRSSYYGIFYTGIDKKRITTFSFSAFSLKGKFIRFLRPPYTEPEKAHKMFSTRGLKTDQIRSAVAKQAES